MKRKHALELQAWLYLGLVIFFIVLAISGEVEDTFGWVFLFLFIGFFGWTSYRNFQATRAIGDEEREHAPPTDPTPEERIAFYQRHMIMALCLALVVPAIFLNDIETLTRISEHSTWKVKVFAWLYQSFGFWPMILALPTLMLLIALVYHIKIKRIKDGRARLL